MFGRRQYGCAPRLVTGLGSFHGVRRPVPESTRPANGRVQVPRQRLHRGCHWCTRSAGPPYASGRSRLSARWRCRPAPDRAATRCMDAVVGQGGGIACTASPSARAARSTIPSRGTPGTMRQTAAPAVPAQDGGCASAGGRSLTGAAPRGLSAGSKRTRTSIVSRRVRRRARVVTRLLPPGALPSAGRRCPLR